MDKYSSPNSLKTNSIKRIILDMINDIKTTSGSQDTLIVMIVDEFTVKILSSIVSMSDLLAKGVFSLEKLEIDRESFPKFHGLYFIAPTEASIKILVKDFEDPKCPQYGRAHIFFSHSSTDTVLSQLSQNDNLVRRLKTCKEVNFSFLVKDNNLFDLGMSSALEIYTTKNDEINRNIILSMMAERLFTVCTVLNEFPYIQYNKNSMYCSKLAEFMHAKLAPFYATKSFNEKRGILLIVDRAFDITSPFLHDYYYECMIYDMFKIKDNIIDFNKKEYKFDEKDKLWMKYKNKHIAEVFVELNQDFNAFMQSDISKMQRGQGNEMQDFEQMSKVLHGIKGYQMQSNQFKMHLDLAEEITNKYKQMSILEIIELEQDIATGVNSAGASVSNKEIINTFALFSTKLSESDKMRLLLTLHSSIDIDEKNFVKMADNFGISLDNLKPARNLKWLGVDFGGNKGRREAKQSKEKIQEFKTKTKNLSYNACRSAPKLESVVHSCSQYQLSRSDFPFIEEPKDIPKNASKGYAINANKYGIENEAEKLPNLIVFMIGGMSHNEICTLEKLGQDKKLNHHLVLGSTSIISASEFIEQLNNLPGPNDNLAGVKLSSIELKII